MQYLPLYILNVKTCIQGILILRTYAIWDNRKWTGIFFFAAHGGTSIFSAINLVAILNTFICKKSHRLGYIISLTPVYGNY